MKSSKVSIPKYLKNRKQNVIWILFNFLLPPYEEFFKFFWKKGKWTNIFLEFNDFWPKLTNVFEYQF